jgi:hypothetical protein
MSALKYGIIAFFVYSSTANSINPLSGWYAGLILGGSKAASSDLYLLPVSSGKTIRIAVVEDAIAILEKESTGVLTYGLMGNVGGQVGYRIKNFRVEGEVVYNNNQFYKLEFPGQTIYNNGSNSTTSTSIQQLITQDARSSDTLQLSGYTNTFAFMANGFYDFYLRDYTTHFVPYVGAGIGYALRTSTLSFLYNGEYLNELSFTERRNQIAGQGIIGLSYFLSDYNSFSLDYRYLASPRTNIRGTERGSFNINPKLYTINLVFNSSFNL